MSKRIAILGSTGSIGRNALEVIAHLGVGYEVVGLSGHSQVEELAEQARRFRPEVVVVTGEGLGANGAGPPRGSARTPEGGGGWSDKLRELGCQVCFGAEGLKEMVGRQDVDVVVAGIVGAAGMEAVYEAVKCGKTVALANKEALVVAGELIMGELRRRQGEAETEAGRRGDQGTDDRRTRGQGNGGATEGVCLSAGPIVPLSFPFPQVLPVDSEHSAVFQALHCGRLSEVRRVILTASGGPFRNVPLEQMHRATPAEALRHPTWQMGNKITIDSATMFNKALELIEARWLFNLRPQQIEVVIHPESVVHSMVEFVDGSVMAQLSPPDMRTPIQYALTYPERAPGVSDRIDLSQAFSLNFEPMDLKRFPALRLAYDVAERGGTLGAVLNAANEVAVEAFLARRIPFGGIFRVVELTIESHQVQPGVSLDDLLEADRWARRKAGDLLAKHE